MSALPDIIAEETRKRGVISFASFMNLALYCPVCGYYEKEADTVGRRGDFYTNVSTGNVFGELLAFQFSEWLNEFCSPKPGVSMMLLEAGAHDGALASDILIWVDRNRPDLFAKLDYVIVEPSLVRRQRQEVRLREWSGRVRWVSSLGDMSGDGVNGIVFCNELLDAMPVHRFGWDAAKREWFEWGVAFEDGKFRWRRMEVDAECGRPNAEPGLPSSVLPVLPEGFIVERSFAAERWWREAAGVLRSGVLMMIDYGLTDEELLSPERAGGTLRGYRRHRQTRDILADPGEQDITAHVNFSAIQRAGESTGLQTELFAAQEQFLVGIAERLSRTSEIRGWTSGRARQFQTLTHPEHLGRRFRVLVQTRR